MATPTHVQTLLSLGLHDSVVAKRLNVSRMTISRWRRGHNTPTELHQVVALAFLTELQTQIITAITLAKISRAA